MDIEPFPSSAHEPEPEPPPDYASWGARVGAFVLDSVLLMIPWAFPVVFVLAGSAAEDGGDDPGGYWALAILTAILALILPFVYFAVLNGNERGQTVGKRVANIRTRRRGGGPLGIGRALGRYALPSVLAWFVGPLIVVDYLWPLWDAEKQALHDKVVDSIVVRA